MESLLNLARGNRTLPSRYSNMEPSGNSDPGSVQVQCFQGGPNKREPHLYLCAILLGISAIGTALPRTMLVFSIFRILGGMGVGLTSIVSPKGIGRRKRARFLPGSEDRTTPTWKWVGLPICRCGKQEASPIFFGPE